MGRYRSLRIIKLIATKMAYGLNRRNSSKKQKGFSLIELSVIISVAASAAVGFLAWTQPTYSTNSQKAMITQSKMRDIQAAIDSFRVLKKRLPCPADPLMRSDNTRATGIDYDHTTATTTDATTCTDFANHPYDCYVNDFGMEDLYNTSTIVSGIATQLHPAVNCPVSVGAVPVRSLGLDDSYANDGWGRRFTYHVSPSLCGNNGRGTTASAADLAATTDLAGCSETDYQSKSGNLVVTNTSSTVLTKSASYVLVSHGANGSGAFLPSGQKLAQSANANEILNNAGTSTTTYVKGDQSSTFDDLVVFATKNQTESMTARKNVKNISVADCEANSQAISKITITETNAMKTNYTNSVQNSTLNTGDQALLSVLWATQTLCVQYYGFAPATINGQTWHGAQCPGNQNVNFAGLHPDGTTFASTYSSSTNGCDCPGGLWNGNCTPSIFQTTSLWLDANNTSSVRTDSGCAAGAAVNGGTVGCWKDLSANANDATQATGSAQPLYQTNITNGLPMIQFNGLSSTLATPSNNNLMTSMNNNYSTLFLVARTTVVQSSSVIFGSNDTNGTRYNIHLPWTDNNVYWDTFGTGANARASVAWGGAVGTTYIWSFRNSNAPSQAIWRNGTLIRNDAASQIGTFNPVTPINIGVGSSVNFWNGLLGEVFIFNSSISTADRYTIEGYLATKWGITVVQQ